MCIMHIWILTAPFPTNYPRAPVPSYPNGWRLPKPFEILDVKADLGFQPLMIRFFRTSAHTV